MRHPYNPHNFVLMDEFAVAMLVIGGVGVITTSRWFICRLCGFSERSLYRWSAFWPLIMALALGFSPIGDGLRNIFPGGIAEAFGLRHIFTAGIAEAFGLAFSIANLRIPSWYSRGLGVAFLLFYCFLIYALFMELRMYERNLA